MNVSKIRPDITIVEKHTVAAKLLIDIARQQAEALEVTLRLLNGAYNDRELNPNEDSPFDCHFPDEVNNSIGNVRDVLCNLREFEGRLETPQ